MLFLILVSCLKCLERYGYYLFNATGIISFWPLELTLCTKHQLKVKSVNYLQFTPFGIFHPKVFSKPTFALSECQEFLFLHFFNPTTGYFSILFSPKYDSQPISLMLLTNRMSNTMLSPLFLASPSLLGVFPPFSLVPILLQLLWFSPARTQMLLLVYGKQYHLMDPHLANLGHFGLYSFLCKVFGCRFLNRKWRIFWLPIF